MSELVIRRFIGHSDLHGALEAGDQRLVDEQSAKETDVALNESNKSPVRFVGYIGPTAVVAAGYELNFTGEQATIEKVAIAGAISERTQIYYGEPVMLRLLDELKTRQGVANAVLDCPIYLMEFYRGLGFIPEGREFEKRGQTYRKMHRLII